MPTCVFSLKLNISLSLFRFKKLADMYGRESDSEDSQEEGVEGLDNPAFYPSKGAGGPPGSESWC